MAKEEQNKVEEEGTRRVTRSNDIPTKRSSVYYRVQTRYERFKTATPPSDRDQRVKEIGL